MSKPGRPSSFRWVNQQALGSRHPGAFTGVWVNNKNRNLLCATLSHAQSGMTTEVGRIVGVGREKRSKSQGVGLNNLGQMALPVPIADIGEAVVLLTPATP